MIETNLTYSTEIPDLTKDQGDRLFERLRTLELHESTKNNQEAQDIRQYIIESVYKMICKRATSFWHPDQGGAALEDIIQTGMSEVIRCLDSYDHTNESGAKFSTYVASFAYNAMNKHIANRNNPLGWPHELLETCSKVIFTRDLFIYHNRREPTMHEVAKLLEVDVKLIEMMFRIDIGLSSLDANLGDDAEGSNLYDYVADDSTDNPFESTTISELSEMVYHSMEDLSERDYLNMTLRFGLRSGYATSIKSIITEYNNPGSEIRELEEQLINMTEGDSTLSDQIRSVLGCHESQPDCKPSDGLLDHLGL